ncbi:head-tail connector protein [Nitratidesulfovibrio sp. 1201_IL3209]|uniref:head-tail connector protein n=1 Tax=Nitratidesulfovibrio sp. 1201_IL3209 TaxID=3084053 RepID=UPI002FD950B2
MSIVTTSLRCTVPADFTALSLEAAKAHLRVEHDADDDLITALISAAQAHAEHETGRVLCEATWEWCLQGPLTGPACIPVAPCASCAGVAVGGVTVDASAYAFTASGALAGESPLFAALTPGPDFPTGDAVTVTVTAGWPDGEVPAAITQWMLVRIGTLYEQREAFAVGANFHEFGRSFVDCLLDPYRIPRGM